MKDKSTSLDFAEFRIGIGWTEFKDSNVEADCAAFMLGKDNKIISDKYIIFYNTPNRIDPKYPTQLITNKSKSQREFYNTYPVDPEISVIGSIDDTDGLMPENDDIEIIQINLEKVRQDVQEIVLTLSIYDYQRSNTDFSNIKSLYVRLYELRNYKKGQENFLFRLKEDTSRGICALFREHSIRRNTDCFYNCNSLELCRFFRKNGEWKFEVLGIGHRRGLDELVEKYT